MSIWSLTYQQSAFKWCHSNKHSPSFTHNMTAKTSWHRRGTKLRHCHPMYTAAFCNCLLGQWRQIIHMSLTEVCSNPCVKLGRLLKAREDQICRYCGCCSEALQEAPLSPRDRAMRRVNWNLANCHATVQKLLIQVLTKSIIWSWRFSRRQCVIDNVHSTMTRSSRLPLSQVS